MNTLLATAGVVFLAELGDKTQLVALGLGVRHRLAPVVLGVILAFLATTALSVIVGAALGAALPTRAVNLFGGLLFIAFAVATLRSGEGTDDESAMSAAPSRSTFGVVSSVAGAMFVAELGDKTMLATATLAARDEVVPVAIGAALGITAAGLVGVIAGRAIGTRLPERSVRIGSAVLFAMFGAALLVSAAVG